MTFFRSAEKERRASSSGTYNPFENPSVPLASVGFDTVYGLANNDAGANVTVDSASTLPIVYGCIRLLSTVVAGCPIEVYRSRGEQLIDFPLFDEANTETTYTPFELWELVTAHLCGSGNAFIYKRRDEHDRIVDLKPVYPGLVKTKLDRESGHKIFLVKQLNDDGSVNHSGLPQVFTDWEIMHIPAMGYNGLDGLSPIMQAAQTIGTAIAGDKLAARFYSAGTQLSGILKVKAPLRNQAQAEGIKARWMSKNAGVAHAGDVAILDAETDFQSITIAPDALQFLESRRWQTTEIARMFGIPPHLVGDVEKSTSWGTGIEQQNIGFATFTISGYTTRIQQRSTRELVNVRGQRAKFNLDHLLQGGKQERYAAYSVAAGGPWMTRNEVRLAENRKPLLDPAYDELLPPQGIGPMDSEDTAPAPGAEATPSKPKQNESEPDG